MIRHNSLAKRHRLHKRDDREVVAGADLDHEAVRVMEEDLVDMDTTLLHPPLHVVDAHLLEPSLHHL
jgi:hypothetical protein